MTSNRQSCKQSIKTVIFFLFLWLFVPVNYLLAQSIAECQSLLAEYVTTLSDYEKPKEGKNYFVHITTSTFPNKASKAYKPSNYSSENIEVKIVLSKGKMFYYSNYLNFYQDNQDVFTVIHPNKLILWKKIPQEKQGKQEENTTSPTNPMATLRKQVLDELTMSACTDVVLAGKKVKQIVMLAKKKMKEKSGIETITYWYNPKEKKIEKQEITFVVGYPTLRQEIIYHDFNPDYRGEVANTAINNVYDSRKKLLKIYSGYTVEFQ